MSLACQKLNQYYELTDLSDPYRISMSNCYTLMYCAAVNISFWVLHPGLKLEYFCRQEWESEWIENAKLITRNAFAGYDSSTAEDHGDISVEEVCYFIVDKDLTQSAHFIYRMMMTLVISLLVTMYQFSSQNWISIPSPAVWRSLIHSNGGLKIAISILNFLKWHWIILAFRVSFNSLNYFLITYHYVSYIYCCWKGLFEGPPTSPFHLKSSKWFSCTLSSLFRILVLQWSCWDVGAWGNCERFKSEKKNVSYEFRCRDCWWCRS